MTYFEQKFNKLLLEQPMDLPPGAEPEAETPTSEPTPDVDTAAAINDVGDNPAINYKKEQHAVQSQQIEQWLGKITEFNEFLNGLQGNSMQAILNKADCDTLFNDVARSETKKISRVAQDLSALIESLKGYLLSSEEE